MRPLNLHLPITCLLGPVQDPQKVVLRTALNEICKEKKRDSMVPTVPETLHILSPSEDANVYKSCNTKKKERKKST